MLSSIVGTNPRQSLSQLLNFALVLSSAFMIWKGLTVVTGSPSPIVVVLSGSMEPAFQRGDLLFLWNRAPRAEVGEIVVYNVRGKDIPIVHRVVRSFSAGQGKGEEKGLPQETTEKEIGGPRCVLTVFARAGVTVVVVFRRIPLTHCIQSHHI